MKIKWRVQAGSKWPTEMLEEDARFRGRASMSKWGWEQRGAVCMKPGALRLCPSCEIRARKTPSTWEELQGSWHVSRAMGGKATRNWDPMTTLSSCYPHAETLSWETHRKMENHGTPGGPLHRQMQTCPTASPHNAGHKGPLPKKPILQTRTGSKWHESHGRIHFQEL